MSPNPSAAAAENPDSPTTTPPAKTPPASPVSSLFLPPKGPAVPLPPPPSSSMGSPAGSSPTTSLPGDDVEAPTWSAGYADSEETTDRAASGSTPSAAKVAVSRAGLRHVIAQAVKTVTNAVAVIAADAVERGEGLWQADPDDLSGISTPAASMLYRRLPDEAKDSDALDLLSLALALGAYVAKNLKLKSDIRQLRAAGALVDEPAAAAAAPA